MSIKRHLFPFVGALVIVADIQPPRPSPGQPADPSSPPSSPGCSMRKSTHMTLAPAAEQILGGA